MNHETERGAELGGNTNYRIDVNYGRPDCGVDPLSLTRVFPSAKVCTIMCMMCVLANTIDV